MGRPYVGYHNKEGKRLTGVTTILGAFGNKGGIISAANRLGLEGVDIKELWYKEAAHIGTLAHDMFEAHINPAVPLPDLSDYTDIEVAGANTAFDAFEAWWNQTNLEIVHTETSLTSEVHQFGGTIDAVGRLKNQDPDECVILDWKTSKGIFGKDLMQVAAYSILLEENTDLKVQGFHIVRLDKLQSDFVHRYFPNMDTIIEAWPVMVQMYELIKQTEARARG